MPLTQKARRHSGRKYTTIAHPEELPYEEEKRDTSSGGYDDGIDKSKFQKRRCICCKEEVDKCNKKLKKKEKIRKVKIAKKKIKLKKIEYGEIKI